MYYGSDMSVTGMLIMGAFLVFMIAMLVFRKPQKTKPSCARCGYAVEGLTELTCPVCGTDLRMTGILTDLSV